CRHSAPPKPTAPGLLRAPAARGALARARIFCSSTTDPYVGLERRLELTRRCLHVLSEHPPEALVVQTRSPLGRRAAALLARIPSVLASVTATTADEAVRRLLEPDSPPLGVRVAALRGPRAGGGRG